MTAMLTDFFQGLRRAGLPVSVPEFLTLLQALDAGLAFASTDDFYVLARTCLVKDEQHYDRFDQVFGHHFHGLELAMDDLVRDIPEDWLRKLVEKHLSDEEKRRIEALGWDALMETLRQRLAEQHERHQGGSKWIGTGGTSPFGAWGYNPAGIRIGQNVSRHRRAVKVWDQRTFRNLDADAELGTRTMQLALRRLRRFARAGAPEVLDLPATLAATARNAGLLDLKLVPEAHNGTKVLLLFDIGGSMDDHVRLCETLFGALRNEFRHLASFYFHNCVYEGVWRDNNRRGQRMPTQELLHTYGSDYRLILVGDASMSPYEILYPGASVEHMNEESGEVWLRRLLGHFPHAAWINPVPEEHWQYTPSIGIVRDLMQQRMMPLTLDGLDRAARTLLHGKIPG